MQVTGLFARFWGKHSVNDATKNRSEQTANRASVRFLLALISVLLASLMLAAPAQAQALTQGWGGIVPGSNDYNSPPTPYRTPYEACKSTENSFPPGLGIPVYGLLDVRGMQDQVDPADGRLHPATQCDMATGTDVPAAIIILFRCSGGGKIAQESCVPSSYPATAEPMCCGGREGNVGSPSQFPSVGDPVSISTGAKTEIVTDYTSGGPHPIEIKRFYRSMMMPSSSRQDGLGAGWRINLVGPKMDVVSQKNHAIIRREDGTRSRFKNPLGTAAGTWKPYTIESDSTGAFAPQNDAKDRFAQTRSEGTNYDYVDENNVTYKFNGPFPNYMTLGQVLQPDGYYQIYEYLVPEQIKPIKIWDGYGRNILLTWTDDVITSIKVPDGTRIDYTYEKEIINGVPQPFSEVLTGVSRFRANGTLIDSISYQYDRTTTTTPLLTGVFDAAGVKIDVPPTIPTVGFSLPKEQAAQAPSTSLIMIRPTPAR